jgi:hypothetical protein
VTAHNITLAPGLTVRASELATQVVAALGMRGSGKSNSMAVIAEGLLAADVQVIILDYVSIWFSLRLDESGKRPSPYQIPVLGGPHGDTVLVPHAGAVVAEALAQSGSSAVLDVSGFSKSARCAFATDFAEALFSAKKLHPGPTFLVLEEAQRFIPQKLFHGQERMLGAFEEIAEVGRNYGLGLGMISQRPQKIAKDVLNLTELLFAFQANGVLERKALAEWVQEKDAAGRSEVNNELPSLGNGECLVWSPSWLRVYGKYRLRKKATYDAGATPLKARAAVKVKALDLAALESSMSKVVEEAKANDPKALKVEVARLRRELEVAQRAKAPPAPPSPKQVKVEVKVPFFPPRLLAALKKLHERLSGDERALADLIGSASAIPAPAPAGEVVAVGPRQPPGRTEFGVAQAPARPPKALAPAEGGENKLTKAARALLVALAQMGGRATDKDLSALSGYRITSSSFGNALSELRTAGCLTGPPERREITPEGRSAAGDVSPPPSGRELLDWWLNGRNAKGGRRLGKCEAALLQVLFEHGTLPREELSAKSGYSLTSSSFGNGISALRSMALAHGPDGGDLTIAEAFREGP